MDQGVDHDELDGILRRCGATWNASQAHGFLCSRIAVRGTEALSPWIEQLLAGAGNGHAMRGECETALESLFHITWLSLAERQSDFVLVLPGDERRAAERAILGFRPRRHDLAGLPPAPRLHRLPSMVRRRSRRTGSTVLSAIGIKGWFL